MLWSVHQHLHNCYCSTCLSTTQYVSTNAVQSQRLSLSHLVNFRDTFNQDPLPLILWRQRLVCHRRCLRLRMHVGLIFLRLEKLLHRALGVATPGHLGIERDHDSGHFCGLVLLHSFSFRSQVIVGLGPRPNQFCREAPRLGQTRWKRRGG